jgi:hypothetical protein
LEAGRYPEHWLLSPAGQTAVLLVVEAAVRAYIGSELCAVTSRLKAMAQASAPPAVSLPVRHPESHQADSHGAVGGNVPAVPVLALPPTSLGSVAGSVFGSVPAVARSSPPLPANLLGTLQNHWRSWIGCIIWRYT